MSASDSKRIARRIPDELSRHNLKVFDEVASPSGVDHTIPEGLPNTLETVKQLMSEMLVAFPDLKYRVEDEVAEGDLVAQRLTGTGTMKGPFMGMQPTGKQARWTEMHVVRIKDGKIVEHWGNRDSMGMLMQLGLVSMPQQQPSMAQPAGRR